MSASLDGKADASFANRLNRLAENQARNAPEKQEVSVLPDWKAPFRLPAALAVALFIGGMAVFASRYARMHFFGGSFVGDEAGTMMIIDFAGAFAIAFLVLVMLRRFGPHFQLAQLVGVIAMIGLMHNAAHMWPSAFGAIYSTAWADEITESSDYGSLYYSGDYTNLALEAAVVDVEEAEAVEEEKQLPTVLRLQ